MPTICLGLTFSANDMRGKVRAKSTILAGAHLAEGAGPLVLTPLNMHQDCS